VSAVTRRALLTGAASSCAAASLPAPRVACIANAFFQNSHADVFISRLLDGYYLDGQLHTPRLKVVSFYIDQFPADDMSRDEAADHGITIYPTVDKALRLGGKRLAVDAVAIIGEHGHYPRTARGNFMYPRKRYFDEVVRVMKEDGRVLPMYQDKYFAFEWKDAKAMFDRVQSMRIPLVCGSTVPLTWRRPPLEIVRGTHFRELLTTSYSDIEEHAYHAIELLQAMSERRPGGETGVRRVRWARGQDVWELARKGDWSRELLNAALARRINRVPAGDTSAPEAFLIEYRDGLRGTVLHLNAMTRDYLFAARLRDKPEPVATCFYLELFVHNHWGFMVRNFEDLVCTGREPNPVARTLVANGIMLAGLESRRLGGGWVDTPELAIAYS
jgi:hypothetical protein